MNNKTNIKTLPPFIPMDKDIILNKNLSSTDKILYAIIALLSSNKYNYCFASTRYFCKLMNFSDRQLRYSLARLKEYNYIKIEYDGKKRKIIPSINKFINDRIESNNKVIDLFDYDWLNEDD